MENPYTLFKNDRRSGMSVEELEQKHSALFTFTPEEDELLRTDGNGTDAETFRRLKNRKTFSDAWNVYKNQSAQFAEQDAQEAQKLLYGKLNLAINDYREGAENMSDADREKYGRLMTNLFARVVGIDVVDGNEAAIFGQVVGDFEAKPDFIGFSDRMSEIFTSIYEAKANAEEFAKTLNATDEEKRAFAESDAGKALVRKRPKYDTGGFTHDGLPYAWNEELFNADLEKWQLPVSDEEVALAHEKRIADAFQKQKYLSWNYIRDNTSQDVLKAGFRIAYLAGGATNWDERFDGVLQGLKTDEEREQALWLAQTLTPRKEGFWTAVGNKTWEAWGDLGHGMWRFWRESADQMNDKLEVARYVKDRGGEAFLNGEVSEEDTRFMREHLGENISDDELKAAAKEALAFEKENEAELYWMEKIRNAKRFQGDEGVIIDGIVQFNQFAPLIALSIASAGAGSAVAGVAGATAGATTSAALTTAQVAATAMSLGGMEMADLHLKGISSGKRFVAGTAYGLTSALLESLQARIMAAPSRAVKNFLTGETIRNAGSKEILNELVSKLSKETLSKELAAKTIGRVAKEVGKEYVADTASETFIEAVDIVMQQAIREIVAGAGDEAEFWEQVRGLASMPVVGAMGKLTSSSVAGISKVKHPLAMFDLRKLYQDYAIADAYAEQITKLKKSGVSGAILEQWAAANTPEAREQFFVDYENDPSIKEKDPGLREKLEVFDKVRGIALAQIKDTMEQTDKNLRMELENLDVESVSDSDESASEVQAGANSGTSASVPEEQKDSGEAKDSVEKENLTTESKWEYDEKNKRHWKAYSPNGAPIYGEWKVVDARNVKFRDAESEDEREFQGRDRKTLNSQAQVFKIADELKPELLSGDNYADRGAPIYNAQGNPVAGNGRTLAVQTAYGLLPNASARALENGKAYRSFVEKFAKENGIEISEDAKAYPLLVREFRQSELTEGEIAKDTNRDVKAEYSRAEAANENSEYFGRFIKNWNPGANGDPRVEQNREFMQKFFRAIGKESSGAVIDAGTGQYTEDAAEIVNDAALAWVIGDVALTSQLFKNRLFFGGAFSGLYSMAYRLAPLRGTQYDLRVPLQAALKNFAALKRSREKLPAGKVMTWEEFKGQSEFGFIEESKLTPEEEACADILVQLFDDYSDRRKSGVARALSSYANVADGFSRGEADLIGGGATPPPSSLLRHADAALRGNKLPDDWNTFFGSLYDRDVAKERKTGNPELKNPATMFHRGGSARLIDEADTRLLADELGKFVPGVNVRVVDDVVAAIANAQEWRERNAIFNAELEAFKAGKHKGALHLGVPGAILRASGLNATEITIKESVLRKHLKKHEISVEDVRNLPEALNNPLMVYEWGTKARSLIVITNFTLNDGRKITAAVKLERSGKNIEVNELSSVHGKSIERLLEDAVEKETDFGKNKLRYVDKNKAAEWLSLASAPLAVARQSAQRLRLAEIIENFENPSIEIREQRAFHGSPHSFEVEENAPFGRFRDDKMGSGEGAQAFGWGHYLTSEEKIAREQYAERLAASSGGVFLSPFEKVVNVDASGFTDRGIDLRRGLARFFDGRESADEVIGFYKDLWLDLVKESKRKLDEIYDRIDELEGILKRGAIVYDGKEYRLSEDELRGCSHNLNEARKRAQDAKDDVYNKENALKYIEAELTEDTLLKFKKEYESFDGNVPRRHLYTAEFDTGTNDEKLLDWTKPLTEEQFDKFIAEIRKADSALAEKIEPSNYSELKKIADAAEAEFQKAVAEFEKEPSDDAQKRMDEAEAKYRAAYEPILSAKRFEPLSEIHGSVRHSKDAKTLSKALFAAGFVGHKFPAASNGAGDYSKGTNYVIYDESALGIVDKVSWLKNADGKVFGAYDRATKEVFIAKNARVDTLLHELGWHATFDWAEQNAPELHGKMREYASNAPEAIKEQVRKAYPDLDEKSEAFLDEVGAHAFSLEHYGKIEALLKTAKDKTWWGKLKQLFAKAWKAFLKAIGKDRVNVAALAKMDYKDAIEQLAKDFVSGKRLQTGSRSAETATTDKSSEVAEQRDGEEEQIEREARANGTWLKAPNGKPSKLNERQWVQVRTEAFKKWFGDWEKQARIEKLKNSVPVEISGNEIETSEDFKTYRKNAKNYGASIRGSYTNKDTGETISVSMGGINEVVSHDSSVEQFQSVAAIPQMIEDSIFIETLSNEDKAKHPDVSHYSYYVCGLKIGGVDYTAKIVVALQKNGERYYDHKLTKIEKGALLSTLSAIHKAGEESTTPFADVKDKRLLSILQVDSSKVVDENGEPRVVYHGSRTGGRFYEFARDSFFSDDFDTADMFKREADFDLYVNGRLVGTVGDEDAANLAYELSEGDYTAEDISGWGDIAREDISSQDAIDEIRRLSGYEVSEDEIETVRLVPTRGVFNVFLNIRNPLIVDYGGKIWMNNDFLPEDKIKEAREKKEHDGVVVKNIVEGGFTGEYRGGGEPRPSTDYIPFSPEQIKSATDNVGTFDAGNPDIRFQREAPEESSPADRQFEAEKAAGAKYLHWTAKKRIQQGAMALAWKLMTYGRQMPNLDDVRAIYPYETNGFVLRETRNVAKAYMEIIKARGKDISKMSLAEAEPVLVAAAKEFHGRETREKIRNIASVEGEAVYTAIEGVARENISGARGDRSKARGLTKEDLKRAGINVYSDLLYSGAADVGDDDISSNPKTEIRRNERTGEFYELPVDDSADKKAAQDDDEDNEVAGNGGPKTFDGENSKPTPQRIDKSKVHEKTAQEIVDGILFEVRKSLFGGEARLPKGRLERADYMKAARLTLQQSLGGAVYDLIAAKDRQKAERHLQRMRAAQNMDALVKESVLCAEAVREGAIRSTRIDIARDVFAELKNFSRLKERTLEQNRKRTGISEVILHAANKALRGDDNETRQEIEKLRSIAESTDEKITTERKERAAAEADGLSLTMGFSRMSLVDMQNVLNKIVEIKESGKEELQKAIEKRNAEMDKDVATLTRAIAAVKRKNKSWLRENTGASVRSFYTVKQRLYDLTRYDKNPEAARAVADRFARDLSRAMARKESMMRATRERLYEAMRESFGMSAHAAAVKLSVLHKEFSKFSLNGAEALSLDQLINIYLQIRQKDYARALTMPDAGFDPERLEILKKRVAMIPAIEEAIGEEGIAYANALCEIKAATLPELQRAYAEETGFGFVEPDEEFYFPLRRDYGSGSEIRSGGGNVLSALPKQYTARTVSDLDIVENDSATRVLLRTEDADAHFVAYHKPFSFARRMFGDKAFIEAVKKHAGTRNDREVSKELDGLSKHLYDVFSPSGPETVGVLDNAIMDAISTATAQVALGMNPLVMAKNVPAFVNYMRERGFAEFFKDAVSPLNNPSEAVSAILDMMSDPAFKSRWGNFRDEELQKIMNTHVADGGNARAARGILKKIALWYMSSNQAGDSIAVLWIGQGIYRALREKYISEGADAETAKRKALDEVIYLTEQTQLTRDVQNKSAFARRSGRLGQVVGMFTREAQGMFAANAQALTDFIANPTRAKWNKLVRTWTATAVNAFLFGFIGELFRAATGDDDEELFDEESRKRMYWSMANSVSSGWVLFGGTLVGLAEGNPYKSQLPGLSFGSNVGRGARKAWRAFEESDDIGEGTADALDEFAEAMIPVYRIYDKAFNKDDSI